MEASLGLVRSVSLTTRRARDHEVAGRDYSFVTREVFLRRRQRGELLEWARVFGDFYGTPRAFVEKQTARGKDLLLTLDVQGAMQVKRKWADARLIFILPPSMAVLRKRLLGRRTEGRAQVQHRLRCAQKELRQASKYDYAVVNDRLSNALAHLKAIILAEGCRVGSFR